MMESKNSPRDDLPPKENLFRLMNDKKPSYMSADMQNAKDYHINLSGQSSQSSSHQDHVSSRPTNSYSLQFHHESVAENVLTEAGTCVDSNTTLNQSHTRPINSCIPLGQAFPQMLGGITEFRKNLMVTVQTGSSDSPHLHQPAEQLERQRQRNRQRMKNLRLDPEFRAQERLRQRQRMFLKRQDPQFREKERILQRVRVREKRNMLKALESGNGLLERLGTQSGPQTSSSVSDDSSSLSSPNGAHVATSNGGGGTNGSSSSSSGGGGGASGSTSNGSLTVYGTLVESSQLGQHLLVPNNFLMPAHNDLHHLHHLHHHHHHHSLDHQHNGDLNSQECPGLHRGCPGSFNFELCRNNMLPNCKVCMKLYQDLSKHARGHKRNHRCNTCGRVFRLKQHLKGHMKTHGDKNLACPHCPYKTCYNFALNRHLILKHSQGQGQVIRPALGTIPPPPPPPVCHLSPQQQPLDISQTGQLSKCSSSIVS